MTAPILAACAALILGASAAEPGVCSCARARTDAEAVLHNDVVFEGRAVRSRRERRSYGGFTRMVRVYTFQVTRWRKGEPSRLVEVETGLGGGDCGVVFHRGRTYTVYAGRNDRGRLGTSICSGPSAPLPEPPPNAPEPDR